MKNKMFIKILLILAGLGIIFVVYKCFKQQCMDYSLFTPGNIKNYLLGFGAWALLVYIVFYAINTVSILPPIAGMSLAAGFIFGPFWGTVGIMTGAFIGTTCTFYISRFFGRGLVDKMVKGKFKGFEEKLNKNGFIAILIMRLVFVIPWEFINYASGLTRIKYKDYIFATLIGILPSVLIQTFFSDRVANFNLKDPKLILAIAGFLLLIFIPTIYLKLKKKTQSGGEDGSV